MGGVVRASRDGRHDIWCGVGAGVGEQDTCGVVMSCVGLTVGVDVRAGTVGFSDKDGREDMDGTADGCCELLGMLLGSKLLDKDGREDADGTADGTLDRDALGCALVDGRNELLGMLLGSTLLDNDGCEDMDGTADRDGREDKDGTPEGTVDCDALGCELAEGRSELLGMLLGAELFLLVGPAVSVGSCDSDGMLLGCELTDGRNELLGTVLGSELYLVVGPAVRVGSCDSDGCDEKEGTAEGTVDCDSLGWLEELGFELTEGCCELLGTLLGLELADGCCELLGTLLGFELVEGCCDLLGMLLGSELTDDDGRDETDGTPDGS